MIAKKTLIRRRRIQTQTYQIRNTRYFIDVVYDEEEFPELLRKQKMMFKAYMYEIEDCGMENKFLVKFGEYACIEELIQWIEENFTTVLDRYEWDKDVCAQGISSFNKKEAKI